jgi:hypothetical protein
MFTCNTRDRKDDYLVWLHNNVELSIEDNSEKYTLSNTQSTLTVRDIDHEDEGNYSCKYTNRTTDRDVCQEAGCLIVYGAVSFASGNDDTDLNVSKGGTVEFSFAIQFSQAGPRGLREEVNRFELRNTAKRLLVECQINGHADCRYMNNNDHQWWTVMGEDIYSITFILHQAQSTDRGPYTARIEGVDPAQRSIDTIDKEYRVIGKYFLLHVYYMYTCIYCRSDNFRVKIHVVSCFIISLCEISLNQENFTH